MFEFQKLAIYQKSIQYYQDAMRAFNELHTRGPFRDQLHRSLLSVPLNIAEGSAKFSKPDRRTYFINARASVFETVAILEVLHRDSMLSDDVYSNLLNQADELSRILYAMIKSLTPCPLSPSSP